MKLLPLEPTPEMVEEGAKRIVYWEKGSVWPNDWSSLDVMSARNSAERVWRSMWLAAPYPVFSGESDES